MASTCLCARMALYKARRVVLSLVYQLSSRTKVTSACCSYPLRHIGGGNSLVQNSKLSGCKLISVCLSRQFSDSHSVEPIHYHNVEKIEAVADDIVSRVRYGDLDTMSRDDISECVKMLVDKGLPVQALDSLPHQPSVLQNPQQLVDLLKCLQDLGLSKKKIGDMISTYPFVLTFHKSTITNTFYKLLDVGFTSDLIVKMFTRQPQILMTNLDSVAKRIEELKFLFNTKHTFSLLSSNPSLLFSDLDDIRKKFLYVYNEMGVTQPQMMHTEIFSYPIEHIHTRHMFVVRSGNFRNVKEKEKFKNPKLDRILDTSDAAFAKKFGNMTVKDYQCFKALLLKEELLYAGENRTAAEDNDEDDSLYKHQDDIGAQL